MSQGPSTPITVKGTPGVVVVLNSETVHGKPGSVGAPVVATSKPVIGGNTAVAHGSVNLGPGQVVFDNPS